MKKLLIVCPHCDTANRVPADRLREGGKCGSCHQPLFEGTPVTLDDPVRFAKHAEISGIPLLVDFSAGWCAPCRAFAPVFQEAAAALEPDVRLIKVDVDRAPAVASAYLIRSMPTLLVIHHGRELARNSGVMSLHQLISWTAAPYRFGESECLGGHHWRRDQEYVKLRKEIHGIALRGIF